MYYNILDQNYASYNYNMLLHGSFYFKFYSDLLPTLICLKTINSNQKNHKDIIVRIIKIVLYTDKKNRTYNKISNTNKIVFC